MRQNYWNDNFSSTVSLEKQFLQRILTELNIYPNASLEDAKYLFFSLPSIIIVKGYSMGFQHESVRQMILKFIEQNRAILQRKEAMKIQYRM